MLGTAPHCYPGQQRGSVCPRRTSGLQLGHGTGGELEERP